MIVIRNGQVHSVTGWVSTDVAIDGERVVAIGDDLRGEIEIDAEGCLVGPGFVDMHTHLREPGQTWKEDIVSASAAAAAGGFTAITAMPNTEPAMDSIEVVQSVQNRGQEVGLVEVIPSAALTMGRSGRTPVEVEDLYELGVRLFTDDGDCLADQELLAALMKRIRRLPGAFIAQHAEDTTRTANGHMHEGSLSRELGIGGLPAAAEADVVQRDVDLVAETGAHYHCQHVSTKMTLEPIRAAKEAGLPVTAEVTPHHLTFNVSDVAGLNPDFKMYPPLRSSEDREALVAAMKDGTIDVVATDHAPHRAAEKQTGFTAAPRGVIGLETAGAAVWEAVDDRDLLFRVLSTEPARILGLKDHGQAIQEGAIANLVVFDPQMTWVPGDFVSKSSNSPYLGRKMRGKTKATIHRGKMAHHNEAVSA